MKKIVILMLIALVAVTALFAQGRGMMNGDCKGDCKGDCGPGMKHQGPPMEHPGMGKEMGRKMGMHGIGMGWLKAIKDLDLTDKQEEAMQKLFTENKKSTNTAEATIENLHVDMQLAMKNAEFSQAQGISDNIMKAKAELHKNQIKLVENVYNQLTAEQKEILTKNMKECDRMPKHQMMHGDWKK
ncbi:MAG: Spy/CpxP family protein refolding chaperone [Candidatus Cloacimonetes bacterium]|nr:Spy/CpxP family protein refolding chaperone [Candidatus Cloacimonadota bacterium]